MIAPTIIMIPTVSTYCYILEMEWFHEYDAHHKAISQVYLVHTQIMHEAQIHICVNQDIVEILRLVIYALASSEAKDRSRRYAFIHQ